MFRTYYNPTPAFAPRRLPSGDCGFVPQSNPLGPFNARQTPRCHCRTFWPNPHSPDLCACGHHACFHSPDPPATSATSSAATALEAYKDLSSRMARLEQRFLDSQNEKRRNELMFQSQQQSGYQSMMSGLATLDDKIEDLAERMEEAEERLFVVERTEGNLEDRVEDLEGKADELEDELDVIVKDKIELDGRRSPNDSSNDVHNKKHGDDDKDTDTDIIKKEPIHDLSGTIDANIMELLPPPPSSSKRRRFSLIDTDCSSQQQQQLQVKKARLSADKS